MIMEIFQCGHEQILLFVTQPVTHIDQYPALSGKHVFPVYLKLKVPDSPEILRIRKWQAIVKLIKDQLLVFLCEDRETEEGWVLDTYRMAKDESEVREWMKQTINGYDTFFSYPTDMSRRIMVYSLEDLREQAEYGVTGVDPEDPEVQKTLPEQDWAWGRTYRLALTDGQKD